MSNTDFVNIMAASEECIERYTAVLRAKVGPFVESHFSLQETIQIQKKYLIADLALYPLNALWSIPYLTIKKSIEVADKIGWNKLTPVLEWLPSGIRTRYQKDIERLILTELMEPHLLLRELQQCPALHSALDTVTFVKLERQIENIIQTEVRSYSTSHAMISDLCGSMLTLFSGHFFFNNGSLSITDLGDRIAQKMAHESAASNFIFGKKLGSAFYTVFPAAPTRTEIFLATFAVGFLLTFFSILVATLSDPLKKKLRLHQNKLNLMALHIEEKIFLCLRKELKNGPA